jgi:hypothetical protein
MSAEINLEEKQREEIAERNRLVAECIVQGGMPETIFHGQQMELIQHATVDGQAVTYRRRFKVGAANPYLRVIDINSVGVYYWWKEVILFSRRW